MSYFTHRTTVARRGASGPTPHGEPLVKTSSKYGSGSPPTAVTIASTLACASGPVFWLDARRYLWQHTGGTAKHISHRVPKHRTVHQTGKTFGVEANVVTSYLRKLCAAAIACLGVATRMPDSSFGIPREISVRDPSCSLKGGRKAQDITEPEQFLEIKST